jgi:hypothetical protein
VSALAGGPGMAHWLVIVRVRAASPRTRSRRPLAYPITGLPNTYDLRVRVTQAEAKPMTSTASANHGARTVGLVTL